MAQPPFLSGRFSANILALHWFQPFEKIHFSLEAAGNADIPMAAWLHAIEGRTEIRLRWPSGCTTAKTKAAIYCLESIEGSRSTGIGARCRHLDHRFRQD
ncbi:MAG: hypothetical protein V4610_21660 [Pseudomonadota bacterium]|jgi:hypothetical protein